MWTKVWGLSVLLSLVQWLRVLRPQALTVFPWSLCLLQCIVPAFACADMQTIDDVNVDLVWFSGIYVDQKNRLWFPQTPGLFSKLKTWSTLHHSLNLKTPLQLLQFYFCLCVCMCMVHTCMCVICVCMCVVCMGRQSKDNLAESGLCFQLFIHSRIELRLLGFCSKLSSLLNRLCDP